MRFYGRQKREIDIYIYRKYYESYFSVKSDDVKWRSALIKIIDDVFRKYSTKNEFFHGRKAYVIYVGIGLMFAVGTYLIFNPYPALEDSKVVNPITLYDYLHQAMIYFSIFSIWVWGHLFQRLFPRIEVKDSIQVKIRRGIASLILGVAIAVIGSGIFFFLQDTYLILVELLVAFIQQIITTS